MRKGLKNFCSIVIIIPGKETGLWLKVEASRRQNDPRKRGKAPVSTVRFRSKSCPNEYKRNSIKLETEFSLENSAIRLIR